jgi:hypothetical protein
LRRFAPEIDALTPATVANCLFTLPLPLLTSSPTDFELSSPWTMTSNIFVGLAAARARRLCGTTADFAGTPGAALLAIGTTSIAASAVRTMPRFPLPQSAFDRDSPRRPHSAFPRTSPRRVRSCRIQILLPSRATSTGRSRKAIKADGT